jgi:uncharacterized Tic20 family protein
MADAMPIDPTATSQDERTMAVLAHVLQLVGGWIGPLVIFLVRRQSRFVSFHALQVLFWHLACVVVAAVLVTVGFISFLLAIAFHHGAYNAPPLGIFVLFPLLWLGFIMTWALTVVIAIVYGIKAGRGEWAEYPVFGGLARRVLKIGPGGAPTQA